MEKRGKVFLAVAGAPAFTHVAIAGPAASANGACFDRLPQ